jgi:SAM-dependent methyltransferase
MSALPTAGDRVPALPSPEFGLALGLVLGRFAFGMEDLHYGYWTDDLPLTPTNLPRAQSRYTEELLGELPSDVFRILDVGCGAGNVGRRLIEAGYQVDGVSPNPWLNREARNALDSQGVVFDGRFEDLEPGRTYDLILFSESFLFLRAEPALICARGLLRPGGYLLISDLFRLPATERSPIGGGQDLGRFQALMARSPFELLRDTDLTSFIAPTFDLVSRAYEEAIRPAYDLILARLEATHPWLTRFARWKFRRQIQRYEAKHFSGRRDADHFKRHKTYRRLLYQLRSSPGQAGA